MSTDQDALDLVAPATATPDVVVVHPGAAFPSRRWPAERFAAVCATLDYLGQPVVVTGSQAEKALVPRLSAWAACRRRPTSRGRLR